MGFIKEIWSDMIYQVLYEDPDLNLMFNRSMEQEVRSGGNKVHIPTIASGVTVTRTDNKSIGDGLPLTPKDVSKNEKTFDIYEYSTEPILIRNIDRIQSNRNLLQDNVQEIAQIFKEFILQTIATHVINNVDSTHKLDWTGGTSGSKFSSYDLGVMGKTLDNAKILSNERFALLKSDEELDLITESGMANWMAIQQSAILNKRLPLLMDFGINKSTLIPLTTAAGAIDETPANNIKRNVVGWRKKHLHLAIQTDFEITGSERAEYLGYLAAFTTRFGVFLERSKGAVISTQQ